MKNLFLRALAFASAGALALTLSACQGASPSDSKGSDTAKGGVTELVVGATPSPHGKILQYLEDSGEAKKVGIKIVVKPFTDYIQPNEALRAGDIDANYYQTIPYLEEESASRGYKFTAGKPIHLEALAIFSDKIKKLDELKDGALISIISDPSNQGRALALLAANGLLKISGTNESKVSVESDKTKNPRGFKFHEVEGAALTKTLPDVDIAVINGNFAQEAGLNPANALAIESTKNNPALNVLVWRADETKKLDAIKKLDDLLHSDVTKKYIEKTWANKAVLPAF